MLVTFSRRVARRLLGFIAPVVALTISSLALVTVSARPAQADDPVFGSMGFLQGYTSSSALGVSADGKTVVGVAGSQYGSQAFRWTVDNGIKGLGQIPGGSNNSTAYGVSANGAVVAGLCQIQGDNGASSFRWTQAGGMVDLGDLPGGNRESSAAGVSADGTVIAGTGSAEGRAAAWRWTAETGLVDIGAPPGGPSVFTRGISANGAFIVGSGGGFDGTGRYDHPVRWGVYGGWVGLGHLPGGSKKGSAYAVSADGSVVVGTSDGKNGLEAFRWTAEDGMVGLGDLEGGDFESVARAVSADGSIVVGRGSMAGNSDEAAFIWTAATGMVDLKKYLKENFSGFLPANFDQWYLFEATGISADGSVIVGRGYGPDSKIHAWRFRYPVPVARPWKPVDVATCRTDNTSRLLWKESTGRYAVWKLSAAGATQTGKYYGPLAGYTCNQIVVAPNGQTTLLWKNITTRKAALWTLAADLSAIVKATTFNYPSGWEPQFVAADQSNHLRLSWRNMATRAVALWTITPATGAIAASATYGPYANLQDGPIAVGADGRVRLLWRNTATGGATLWTIPSAYGAPSAGYNYNPVPGAVASDIAVGADNKTRVLWAYATRRIAVWKLNTTVGGTGVIEAGKFFGPYADVAPLGVSVGGDNQTRQLWTYSTGRAALWALNDPLTAITASYLYGPIN